MFDEECNETLDGQDGNQECNDIAQDYHINIGMGQEDIMLIERV
jgi:hypothetical protein